MSDTPTPKHDPFLHDFIVERIHPILEGRGPEAQGAILAELLATWIAGHHPKVRDKVLRLHVRFVRELVPVMEKIRFGDRGFPADGEPR